MKESSDTNQNGAGGALDPLAQAFRAAAAAHVAVLKGGTALEVFTAYRVVLVAEVRLLRDCGGTLDSEAADVLEYEIERVDRDLADLAVGKAAKPLGVVVSEPDLSTTMRIEIAVPAFTVFDTIVSGVEGGIQYWAKVVSFWVPSRAGVPSEEEPVLRVVCDVVELTSGERFALQDKWGAALRLMAERYPRMFAELMQRRGDRRTGDALIQLAAFGQLRYS